LIKRETTKMLMLPELFNITVWSRF